MIFGSTDWYNMMWQDHLLCVERRRDQGICQIYPQISHQISSILPVRITKKIIDHIKNYISQDNKCQNYICIEKETMLRGQKNPEKLIWQSNDRF